jgi:hypothetical protein
VSPPTSPTACATRSSCATSDVGTVGLEDFTSSFFQLFKETVEGPPPDTGSAYLDKGSGLLQTLDQVTAEAASTPGRPGGPTIAAHCEHVRYYIHALHGFMRGAQEKVDWQRSWQLHEVTPEQWNELKDALRREYSELSGHLRSLEGWGEDEVGDGMAILVHTAYHLGAIRQLVQASRS